MLMIALIAAAVWGLPSLRIEVPRISEDRLCVGISRRHGPLSLPRRVRRRCLHLLPLEMAVELNRPTERKSHSARLRCAQCGAMARRAGHSPGSDPRRSSALGASERFDTGPAYRSYELSRDYWLYSRWIKNHCPGNVIVVGDRWCGASMCVEGALPAFLEQQKLPAFSSSTAASTAVSARARRHPHALRKDPAGQKFSCIAPLAHQPRGRLEFHQGGAFQPLAPRTTILPRFPLSRRYHERISAAIENRVPLLAWTNHLQNAYFEQKAFRPGAWPMTAPTHLFPHPAKSPQPDHPIRPASSRRRSVARP
jgi:hypothetical protein